MATTSNTEGNTLGQRIYDGDILNLSHRDPALINNGSIIISIFSGVEIVSFTGVNIETNSSLLEVLFCEGADITGGTPVAAFNRNRNEKASPILQNFTINPTINDPGSVIYDQYLVGTTEMGVNKTATSKNIILPWLLEPNIYYLFKITNIGGDTSVISMGLHLSK